MVWIKSAKRGQKRKDIVWSLGKEVFGLDKERKRGQKRGYRVEFGKGKVMNFTKANSYKKLLSCNSNEIAYNADKNE